jgi:hypothetical protein
VIGLYSSIPFLNNLRYLTPEGRGCGLF